MKRENEKEQIKEVIKRLNYYEKGLMAGKKIKHQECNLCRINIDWNWPYSNDCATCLASSNGYDCFEGVDARSSVSLSDIDAYNKRVIRTWQTELRRRANANLKAAGSKWRIVWEREE